MKCGAGILLICPKRKSILIALRTDGSGWANFGGQVEKGETPLQCAKRELLEESGFMEGNQYNLYSEIPVHSKEYIRFMYFTYIGIVDDEVIPDLNYEHTQFEWRRYDTLPENLNFGFNEVINNEVVLETLQSIFDK